MNEAFNNILWRIAPKSEFSALPTLELSSYLAVIRLNYGEGGLRVLNRESGWERYREACYGYSQEIDIKMIKKSDSQEKLESKKRRHYTI